MKTGRKIVITPTRAVDSGLFNVNLVKFVVDSHDINLDTNEELDLIESKVVCVGVGDFYSNLTKREGSSHLTIGQSGQSIIEVSTSDYKDNTDLYAQEDLTALQNQINDLIGIFS